MKKGFFALVLAGLVNFAVASDVTQTPVVPQGVEVGPGEVVKGSAIIPNAPIIEDPGVIELSAVGMGVAPMNTISPAQALAMAKRAAIIDGYRQLGEKMYGIKVNSKETVKDMVMQNSVVRTRVLAVIKNAEIVETAFKDGLCQVQMELKLDAKRWYYILTGQKF